MKLIKSSKNAIEIELISMAQMGNLSDLPKSHAAWLKLNNFGASEGEISVLQDANGQVSKVYFGVGKQSHATFTLDDPFNLAKLKQLPNGDYTLVGALKNAEIAYFAFALADYSFDRYKQPNALKKAAVNLVIGHGVNIDDVQMQVDATNITRDLVNTPANDLGPAELAAAVKQLADKFGADYNDIIGDDLLDKGFTLIHTVGRASDRAPRLVELKWRGSDAENLPKITLVGKGVVFDTGGLDLKPAAGMITMKKDMGGAANVIGLCHMIMGAKLPIDLTLLIGAVENSVSSNAFRPSDVFKSYKGLTVEIGNTDAEGRLVLADLLAYADESNPDLLLDMATLTGAARVAVGPEIAAYFTEDMALAQSLNEISANIYDPIWQLPLHKAYLKSMNSKVADINNISSMPLAGASTAALFLAKFVENAKTYIHWDLNSWNISDRPARPVGGEAQGIRTIFSMIKQKYT
ncbi:MAG: leucyl aminopeptidase family protein [Rhizobiales bacterium]|nr:leucyl aminopeptidase family protein [Hyphomicrobiales bacterium]